MSEGGVDLSKKHQLSEPFEKIAAAIFAKHGINFSGAKRVGGWTNANWLAGGLVLHLSTRPGRQSLRREARLSTQFPAQVGYPEVVESGETEGFEWLLAREITGQSLGEVWPDLDAVARATALRQIWQRAQAVHALDEAAVDGLVGRQAWFNISDAKQAADSLQSMAQQKLFTPGQTGILIEILDRFWKSAPAPALVLNHGDLTIDNVMWHNGQVVALIDFEYCVIAPVELDLNHLIKCAYGPPERAGQEKLLEIRQVVAELALPLLARPGAADRLCGYAVLLESWLMQDWLAHPEGEGPVETWEPYRRLLSLADGQAGYLSPLLHSGEIF